MYNKIDSLLESPCFECEYRIECGNLVNKVHEFREIVDYVWPRKDYDRHWCGLYKSLEAKYGYQN